MTFKDFLHIQTYFKNEEHRDPSVTEIRVLDTYWSDHCRHTTFLTELTDVKFAGGRTAERLNFRRVVMCFVLEKYQPFLVLYKGRDDKYISLMDIALLAMKKLRAEGKLSDMEVSDEINACSIVVPVTIDGVTEEWLVFFKNETHNHPTPGSEFSRITFLRGAAPITAPISMRFAT